MHTTKAATDSSGQVAHAIAQSRRTFVGLAVFSFFVSLLMLTGPLYMLQVYDRVLASNSIPTLVALTLLVAGLYATLGILDWCRQSLFSVAGSQIEGRLSAPTMDIAFDQSLAQPGQTGEQAIRELRQLRRFMSSPAMPALFDAPFAPLFFAVLFMLHWVYGLWALIGAAILVTLALVNQWLNRASIEQADREERAANLHANEMLRHVEVTAALGMGARLRNRWQEAFDSSDNAITQSGTALGGFTAATKAIRLLMQSGILGLGAYLSIVGTSTPGAMIAASILMGRAIAPIEQSIGQWRSIASALNAWSAIRQRFEAYSDAPEPMQLPPIKGAIRCENLVAAAPGQSTPILKRLNFAIGAGETIGLIGPSASGKSSLARIMLGLWPTLAGTMRIDGADIGQYPREILGPQIGYMPQKVDLFAGTVRENISRFDADAAPEAVIAAAEAANCHELILRLPDGYDSQIGVGGAFLSEGQRQRIGLARALFGNPALIVLDEPNANLDTEGDAALQAAILKLKNRGATVIIIAHRPNTITHCDKLLVLKDGEIAAFGPKDEVLAQISPKPIVQRDGKTTTINPGTAANA